MKTKYIKKLSVIIFGISLIFTLGIGHAYGWGSAVHAYIDDHLGRKAPVRNLNEIYGAMAPDVFNFLFSNPEMMDYLYFVTHYQGKTDDFLNVWDNSHNFLSKAVAFGFVSHNGQFGADLTAHHLSLALPEGNQGYVIEKRDILKLYISPLLNQYYFPPAVVDELCHDLIEFALDIVITQQNKGLAAKISTAAMFRTPEFPLILVKSYAQGLALQNFPGFTNYLVAANLIIQAESEFRKSMISYGQALMQDQDTAIALIAQQLVDLAKAFLGGLPEGSKEEDFLNLAKYGLVQSMVICNEDFQQELQETIKFVAHNLANNGISD